MSSSGKKPILRVGPLQWGRIILLGIIFADGAGRQFIPAEAAEDVSKAANAPVYAPVDTFLGRGIVGGYMGTFEAAGAEVADLALEILRGKDPRSIEPRSSTAQRFRVDARQLRRWNLAEETLPAEAIVYFKSPTLWEQHRGLIIGTIIVISLQGSLIAALLLQIYRRRRLEESLQDTQSKLARVVRMSTMGEMAASIAHEINQPLAAIVANSNAGLRWLSRPQPVLDEVTAALNRVVRDGHRASAVISSVRAMFKSDAPEMGDVDLNHLVREVLALMQSELRGRGVTVHSSLTDALPIVRGERVQLQQVIVNLITNAVEAMDSVADRGRYLRISTRVAGSSGVNLQIEDSGTGIEPERRGRIFDTFYTTKLQGMGMGLAICRNIVESHGGRISASPASPHGAIFLIELPLDTPERDNETGA